MNETQQPAVAGPVEPTVRPRSDDMQHGWYWVRFDQGGSVLTEPQPALWDGKRWRSLGWSGQALHDVLHLERCEPPGRDPLQGAADWLCKSRDEDERERWISMLGAAVAKMDATEIARVAEKKDAERWRHCKAHGHPMTGPQCIAWTYDGRMVFGATPEEAVDNAMAYRVPAAGAA